jgi:hypothetical protein
VLTGLRGRWSAQLVGCEDELELELEELEELDVVDEQ